MKDKINLRFGAITLIVFVTALSRLVFTNIPNISPVTSIALFGAAYFSRKYWAVIVPFLALWVSDVVLNNTIYAAYYDGFSWFGMPAVYLGFLAIVLMGTLLLKKIKVSNLIVASLAASTIFFLITNLGAWWAMPVYTKDVSGLLTAFTAGIPFFKYTILGDLLFSSVLFGGYELLKAKVPAFA